MDVDRQRKHSPRLMRSAAWTGLDAILFRISSQCTFYSLVRGVFVCAFFQAAFGIYAHQGSETRSLNYMPTQFLFQGDNHDEFFPVSI